MAAVISGTVLASLFFDHADVKGEMEGLLFGKVTQRVKDTISDSQINNYKVETKTYINSYYKGDETKKFHDRACRIDTQLIHQVTPEGSQVIGWYRCRHNSSPYPSMREQCIHNNFLTILPINQQANFIFLLITGTSFENLATHNFDFDVLKCSKRAKEFVHIPLMVLNLGDTTHSEYNSEYNATNYDGSGRMTKVIDKHRPALLSSDKQPKEVKEVMRFADDLQSQLVGLTDLVVASEMKLQCVQKTIQKKQKLLKNKLNSRRESKIIDQTERDSGPGHTRMKYEHKKKDKSGALHIIRLPSDLTHFRKLSTNDDSQSEQSPTPLFSRKLSTDYEVPHLDAIETHLPQRNSLVDVTEGEIMDLKTDQTILTQQTDTHDSLFESCTSKNITAKSTLDPFHEILTSDPFSFVEGYMAQEKSGIQMAQSSKKCNKIEIDAENEPREAPKSTSAINPNERRSGRNSTRNNLAQTHSDTTPQRITRSQRSRSQENKVTQDDNFGLSGNCGIEANGEVTMVTNDSSEEGTNQRTKEEGFEISSSPVY
ncbi:uncharacterized protein LOC133200992 [Saccostrea echinata]|uniref:uncharacterized protein LOC133200992 n=1 Tax=Saccostrea echinata TaxID=191078 RepID=UPI002A82281E|nr:uncharacterized protein LOC133200992 [Saccostrea echinata]